MHADIQPEIAILLQEDAKIVEEVLSDGSTGFMYFCKEAYEPAAMMSKG